MSKATQHSTICTGMCQTDWVLDSYRGKSELEKLDNQSAHQYIPMDVYVDPQTIKEHFQASSIHNRWLENKESPPEHPNYLLDLLVTT